MMKPAVIGAVADATEADEPLAAGAAGPLLAAAEEPTALGDAEAIAAAPLVVAAALAEVDVVEAAVVLLELEQADSTRALVSRPPRTPAAVRVLRWTGSVKGMEYPIWE
jgi:hypothetical protein